MLCASMGEEERGERGEKGFGDEREGQEAERSGEREWRKLVDKVSAVNGHSQPRSVMRRSRRG